MKLEKLLDLRSQQWWSARRLNLSLASRALDLWPLIPKVLFMPLLHWPLLPSASKLVHLFSQVWSQTKELTSGQTDGRTDGRMNEWIRRNHNASSRIKIDRLQRRVSQLTQRTKTENITQMRGLVCWHFGDVLHSIIQSRAQVQ